MHADRIVVLLCGPPGAGKTTLAHASGLDVYDRDDPQWTSERQFREALGRLGSDPLARAAVIRTGATSSARAKAAALVKPSHIFLVLADRRECDRRISVRARADHVSGHVALTKWFQAFDRDDDVSDFPGWPAVLDGAADLAGEASEEW